MLRLARLSPEAQRVARAVAILGENAALTRSAAARYAGRRRTDRDRGDPAARDRQWFEDAGWRVGPRVTVGGGPLEHNPSDMVDISFVGIFSGGS